MKLLVDEQVPVQFRSVLAFLLPAHEVCHVQDLRWKSKTDVALLTDAAGRGFSIFLTNDIDQLNDPAETDAIRKSEMHHVRYKVPRTPGLTSQGLALGAVAATMPLVVKELMEAPSQRLVEIKGLAGGLDARAKLVDPQREPPRYWR